MVGGDARPERHPARRPRRVPEQARVRHRRARCVRPVLVPKPPRRARARSYARPPASSRRRSAGNRRRPRTPPSTPPARREVAAGEARRLQPDAGVKDPDDDGGGLEVADARLVRRRWQAQELRGARGVEVEHLVRNDLEHLGVAAEEGELVREQAQPPPPSPDSAPSTSLPSKSSQQGAPSQGASRLPSSHSPGTGNGPCASRGGGFGHPLLVSGGRRTRDPRFPPCGSSAVLMAWSWIELGRLGFRG
ncbi:unnamed protein product [Urochloa humidicola]